MRNTVFVLGSLLLLGSFILNGMLIKRLSDKSDGRGYESDWLATSDPSTDLGQAVRVRSIRDTILPAGEKAALHKIVGEFCQGIESPTVTVYPRLNLERKGKPKGLCENYHQVEWTGSLPDTFELELVPGDEVHIQQSQPKLAQNYVYQVTDFTTGSHRHRGYVGSRRSGHLYIGNVVCKESYHNPGDSSGSGRQVIQIEADDRARLLSWIDELNDKRESPSGRLSVASRPAPEKQSWHGWEWPAGTEVFRILDGDYLMVISLSESDFVLYSYDYD